MTLLASIQKGLKAPKSQTNAFGKYKYRSCEDILEAVKPLLGDGTLVLSDELVLIGDRYYVKATAALIDDVGLVSTTTAYAREELDKKGMDAAQITGACSSYARKYALNGLFLIDDTKDADTMDNTTKEKPKQDVTKVTPQQKIDIRAKMVEAGITEHDEQIAFYNFVMTKDSSLAADRFIAEFNDALEVFRKAGKP